MSRGSLSRFERAESCP
ncbi:hypothetical protein [Erwinia amylovora]|nr:hypothetical protein [Erwinia amylovora]MCK8421206.1 hypothetical protein [Erwinia amylovora]